MVIVSTREFKDNQRKYFKLAEEEKVFVKRGKKYINLFVTDTPNINSMNETWVKGFFSIPAEHRCDPFEMSPSGDLFWADKRNVEYVQKQIAISGQQIKEGKYTACKTLEESYKFLDSL
jgi:hypothetical protein